MKTRVEIEDPAANVSEAAQSSKQNRPADCAQLSRDCGTCEWSANCSVCRATSQKLATAGDGPQAIPCLELAESEQARVDTRLRNEVEWEPGQIIEDVPDAAFVAAEIISQEVPNLMGFLSNLSSSPAADAVLLRNLPVCDYKIANLISLGLSVAYGQPFQYRGQNGGSLVARLEPKPEFGNRQNTGESGGEFSPHSDDAILAPEFSTDWIQLLGLNNESQAATGFIPVDRLVNELSETSRKVLAEPRFAFRAPASFRLRMNVSSPPSSILFRLPEGELGIKLPTYNCWAADPTDVEAAEALREIVDLTRRPELSSKVVIGVGDCLIFRNDRGLHWREGITGKRLVLRTYVKGDLTALREKSGERGPIFGAWELMR